MAVPRITKEELKERLDAPDAGARPVVVDVRLKYPYEHSSVKLPEAVRFAPTATLPALPRDRDIVLYDSDPDEIVSARVAADLIRQGYRARALKGGIPDWIAAKYPLEAKEAPKGSTPAPGSLKG
jgi:rhodanese-related sulfurtransferase